MTSMVGTVTGSVVGVVGAVEEAVVKAVDAAVVAVLLDVSGLLEMVMWPLLPLQAHSVIISKRTMMVDNVLFIVVMDSSFCCAMRYS